MKINQIQYKLFVILILFVLLVNVKESLMCGHNQSEINKQWYLLNDGIKSNILIDKDFCSIEKFKKGIDINIYPVWNHKQKKGSEIVVAIIDTGVDFNHEDLHSKMWTNRNEIPNDNIDNDSNGYIDDLYGWNFCDGNNDLLSGTEVYENDHGTCCAGIIAAQHNRVGIHGIAGNYDVKIMSVKVLKGIEHKGEVESLIAGIKYSQDMGAKICNLSLGVSEDNIELREVIKNSKMLFIVSAGNGGNNNDYKKIYPAAYNFDNVITVSNIGFDGNFDSKSNYGKKTVDLAAPGTYIYSLCVNGYDYDSGSSMSTAMVTGASVVLYAEYGNKANPKSVKRSICNSVTKLDSLNGIIRTEGILNVDAAKDYFFINYE